MQQCNVLQWKLYQSTDLMLIFIQQGVSQGWALLYSIPIKKCNLPYEICLWERIANRIIKRGRINMEKAPMYGQHHYNFCAVWCHIWWTEKCLSELVCTSLIWASLWRKSGNWDINTAIKAGQVALQIQWQTPFSWTYLHVGKGGPATVCCCTWGVSFLSSYLNNPIWITSLILVRLWPKGNPDQLFAMFIPRVWPTWNMWISSSSWELLTALIGKCKGEGRMLTSREGLHVGGSRWAFNVQSNMHWYKVSKF